MSSTPADSDAVSPFNDTPLTRLSGGRSHWLGWAAFLGVSWTWCIGMFLPVLLVRDYGLWGWIVFAIPNVIGAAAMGWVLRSAESSDAIARTHRWACKLFSGVTIAFHFFFCIAVIGPLATSLIGPGRSLELGAATFNLSRSAHRDFGMDIAIGGVAIASIIMYLYMSRREGANRVLAWCVLILSMIAMAFVGIEINDVATYAPDNMPPIDPRFNAELIWLAPVCLFGFLFCPYLDLTFHRARQHSSGSRSSFGAGFGVFFFVMIIFTLIYARAFSAFSVSRLMAIFIVAHMAIQASFTIAAHAVELREDGKLTAIITAALTLASWIAYWWLPDHTYLAGHLLAGEVIYRVFMGFYGLFFPAYVWLVMIPGKGRLAPTLWTLVVYTFAVLLAMPCFWMGFIAQKMIWLAPGMAIVLLARLLVRSTPGTELRVFPVVQQNSEPI